ncbi:ribonucleoside-triphosphate reductase, adenosylcobalamin-dependent (plasmid) [Streptomyces sp. BI20]|uniref:ribonucleoside-triphosphate reductase, adenosylcobalamin-dependent n=1 Tax=Streptomyces sp. BI20 TaxID=3403460 RepID=UPI003C728586
MTFKTETARTVFERTYSRTKPDGSKETWEETVTRVVDGNLALVDEKFSGPNEREDLIAYMRDFKILPAGRHLKSSGVSDYALNNCWAAGWEPGDPAKHYTFTFMRLMEGGGVGSNYSARYLKDMPPVVIPVDVHIVCDPRHQDYAALQAAGLLSTEYDYRWSGAFPVQDSREGWAKALGNLIRTAHNPTTQHANRVFDVSRVRPKGAPLRRFGGTASGPQPFAQMLHNVGQVLQAAGVFARPLSGLDAMEIDHEIAQCVVSGGVRRSARMSIMHWADPDIEKFMSCKADQSKHWTTNISVEIDDAFTEALDGLVPDGSFEAAKRVAKLMADGMHANGEPGWWNSSYSAGGEPDGTFATNPCGEITLNEWEPCNLGHVNLGEFVDDSGRLDYYGLLKAHRLMTRYLMRATFAKVEDPSSQYVIEKNRRIGVGHFGFADMLAKLNIPYSEAVADPTVENMLYSMAEKVEKFATEYAHRMRIPVPVKKRTIAPTGTVAKLAGASGEGIHPIFAKHFIRRIRFSTIEPSEVKQVEEYRAKGFKVEPCIYAPNTAVVEIPTADPLWDIDSDIQSVDQLAMFAVLDVQRMYQEIWADNAVSMTVNFDPSKITPTKLIEIIEDYGNVLKGTTIFPEVSRDQAPYERIPEEHYYAITGGSMTGEESRDTGYDEICASGACGI